MNLPAPPLWRLAATATVLAAWAVASHLGSLGIGGIDFSVCMALLPLVLAGVVLLWHWRSVSGRVAGLAAMAVAMVGLWPLLRSNAALLYYLEHVGSLLALAALFGRSLIGPGDALITSVARSIYAGTLSQRKQRYTRQVTLAWTLFFLINGLLSTALFALTSVRVWSVYAHLLTGPLVGLMFLAEHLVRTRVLPSQERPSLADVLRAYRQRTDRGALGAHDTELPL